MADKNSSKNNQDKVKDFKGTFRKLCEYLGRHKIMLILAIVCSIISSIFSVLGPKFLGDGTTIIFEGSVNIISGNGLGMNFDGIKRIILILITVYGLSAIFAYIESLLLVRLSLKVTYRLRKEVSEKINRLPLKYFDKKPQGDILSYITNDIDTVSWNLDQIISNIVSASILIFGIAFMMFAISWKMTVVAFLVVPFSLIIVAFIVKRSQKYFKMQQEYLANLNGYIEEMYSNHDVVWSFNGQKEANKNCDYYNNRLYNVAWRSQFYSRNNATNNAFCK